MSKFNEYLEAVKDKEGNIEFSSYQEFKNWLNTKGQHYDRRTTIKITVPNQHGNKIVYNSPLDVLHAHEE